MKRRPADDRFAPLSRRRRLLVAALALATVVLVVWLLTERPGGVKRPPPGAGPDRARCGPGQTDDCVGGKAVVIVPAAQPAASR
jgi:hypothetical protein